MRNGTFVVTGVTSGVGLALAHTAERLVIVGRSEAGARGPLPVATAPALARTTGRFFNQTEEMPIDLPVDLESAVVQRTIELLGQRRSSSPRTH